MYDRNFDGNELNFEASGGLMDASLVMRDKETDSWWSIMSSTAIGGDLDGAELIELPQGEKAMWADWKRRHPDTLVLSVNGVEHLENNPYDSYFTSDRTFRGMEIDDHRLAAKAPIYSFWLEDEPIAIAHNSFAGGMRVDLDDGRALLFYRPEGASVFLSTRAYVVTKESAPDEDELAAFFEQLEGEQDPDISLAQPLGGFDTYWYNWIAVNPQSRLLLDEEAGDS